ncbi:lipoprotein-releasing system transmembrane subunit LolC, partial [Pseudomonadales bacterium]|nr:lipoprotein-releasing system transmembrane subunit LolC [Pseudomonadales bacterium]
MKFRIPFEIAFRYARSRKDTGYLSFISKVSLVGMSLGVIVLTVIVSVMNGFDTELKHRILGAVPHVVLVDQGANLERDVLMSNPDVAYVARFQQRQGMVVGRNASKLITIYGVDAVSEPSVSVISSHMVDGEMTVLTPGS